MWISLLGLGILAIGINADYDYGGRDYVRQKAERVVFGLWEIKNYEKMLQVVDDALTAGYRTFDTAQAYANEELVGKAFNELLPKHGLKREDIFMTSKVWGKNQGALAEASVIESLEKLNLGYIDLMLIHWPGFYTTDYSDPNTNKTARRGTWETLEKYYGLGKFKAIGVSNYLRHHLDDLLSYAKVYPAVDQCENSFNYQTNKLVDYCEQHNIEFWAYSCTLHMTPEQKALYQDSKVELIAKKYGISTKMLLYVYSLSQDMKIVTRASSTNHIKENLKALDIKLDGQDAAALKLIDTVGHKACGDPRVVTDDPNIAEIEQ